jgi:hypothetical protein
MNDDRTQRSKLIEQLVTCYPRFAISNATLNAYADHLSAVPLDKLEKACNALAQTSTFFPSIAEILQRANPQPQSPHITGYRFVRGTHGSTYVRDPEGTDKLPGGSASCYRRTQRRLAATLSMWWKVRLRLRCLSRS